MKSFITAAMIFNPVFYVGLSVAHTRPSYCRILCLDALLQIHLFTLPGFRLNCRVEESNECYQHLCILVNKHSTSECPGICRFTAAEYNRIGAIGPEEEGRMPSKICLNLAWITTATPTPTTTEATSAAGSIADFRDLNTESNTCKRLCERLFNRIVQSCSSFTPRNDRRCFFESCQGVIGSVAATDDYNECPSICDSMSNEMHYLHLPVLVTMKEARNICSTLDFPEKARKTLRKTAATTAVTYSNETFSNCEELCEYLFSRIVENFHCTHSQSKQCLLDTCLSIIRSEVSTYHGDIGEECSEICIFISDEMPDNDIARYMTTMEINRFCASGVSPKRSTKPPRTTAVTNPYEEFSNCKKLCVYVFSRTLKPYKFFCPDGGKKYNTCVLRSCKEVVKRTLMDDGQYAKNACPNLCSSMAIAMRGRNLDGQQFSEEQIRKLCLEIAPSVRTSKPPRTTAVTYPYEEFSKCENLCMYVFPRTLKPFKYFCPDGGKKYNPCVLSSCKEVINATVMDDGRDPKDVCPKMCLSMATAMLGRNMDRRQFGKENISEFCSSIDSTTKTTTEPAEDMVIQVW
ncbi:hypothetical protein RB195_017419 [Necator americanus]|uniref:Uncharacterized protein n=1 Tax=Necator americanus TaxID=51031 RepID=A0ABR1C874_NECAM